MTVTDLAAEPLSTVDLDRWPAMASPAPAPLRAAIARRVLRQLAQRTGLRVELPDGSTFGPPFGARFLVHDPEALFRRLGRDGKVGFGESYMARDWDAPDLVGALEPLARSVATLVPPRLQWLRHWYDTAHPAAEDNDPAGARRNIARHYDLSNELFAAFLDPTMTYSGALFDPRRRDSEPLAAAQARKIDRLLDTAAVWSGKRVLEVGTGWGELALRAARRGAWVTTITLSREQAALARDRIAAAGFAGSVDVRVADYREVTGQFDAVVSVEMIEAVGARWWPVFFRTLDDLLAPGGRVGLQAILMPHDRMLATHRSWTWIHKYIFPGGVIPSEEAITDGLARHTRLAVLESVRFGASYAETLKRWRKQFAANAGQVAALGFDDTFRRMWTFYLAYCEAGFRARYLDVAQFTLARREETA